MQRLLVPDYPEALSTARYMSARPGASPGRSVYGDTALITCCEGRKRDSVKRLNPKVAWRNKEPGPQEKGRPEGLPAYFRTG